jgi:predicted nucleic acid-binding protein
VSRRFLFDTSVYIAVLRDAVFAAAFRERYLRDVPLTHFSSVVIEELVAGALTARHRAQAAALYEPFERVGRIVTPTHAAWKEAGRVLADLARVQSQARSRIGRGLLNDTLIALSGRAIGARVVTRDRGDFLRLERFVAVAVEVLP